MAFASGQVTLSAATATDLFTAIGLTSNLTGSIQDPIPVKFYTTAATVYFGGPGVTNSNGYLMLANSPEVMNVYDGDVPYCYQVAGGAVIYVVVGRQ